MLSTRAHFWLRLVALAAILFAEVGPRLWNAAPSAQMSTIVADRAP